VSHITLNRDDSKLNPDDIASHVQVIASQVKQLVAQAEPRVKQYACLVDAENTQHSKLEFIMDELNGYGEVVVRRVYGDFSQPALQPYKSTSNALSFRPLTQFAIMSGKGSSDMVMAMDAIDLVHNSELRIDGYALVSSDSDFTPLALNLREKGKHVLGFGRQQTPKPFVNACHAFVYLENLGTSEKLGTSTSEEHPAAEIEVKKLRAEMQTVRNQLAQAQQQLEEVRPAQPKVSGEVRAASGSSKADTHLSGTLANLDVELGEAIAACRARINPSGNSDSWVCLGAIGDQLRRQRPDWDVRSYGVSKRQGLSGLLELPELKQHFQTRKEGGSGIVAREKKNSHTKLFPYKARQ
jgi:uncharacterized protein (TIGR00288 family)